MKPETLALHGKTVNDIESTKVGEVVDFFIDAETNEAEWLAVETGFLDHRTVLVPIVDITVDGEELMTPYPKGLITVAPRVEGPSIDKATERALYEHYHVQRELPGRTDTRPAFEQNRSETGDFRLRSWKAWQTA